MFIDESGDHTYTLCDSLPNRFLALLGLVVERSAYERSFHVQLLQLKSLSFPKYAPHEVILHRSDIIAKRGVFANLQDGNIREQFDSRLLEFLSSQRFRLITVVLDKKAHIDRYGSNAFEPYHFSMTLLMERFAGFLRMVNGTGVVVAEARGKREDRLLNGAFQGILSGGTQFRPSTFFSEVLASSQIRFVRKRDCESGLQIADLLAHPCKLGVLANNSVDVSLGRFNARIIEAVRDKFNSNSQTGAVEGYGQILIPKMKKPQ